MDWPSGSPGRGLTVLGIVAYLGLAWYPFHFSPPRQLDNQARLGEGEIVWTGPGIVRYRGSGRLLEPAIESGRFRLRLKLAADAADQSGTARILTFSADPFDCNLTLAQRAGRMVLRMARPGSSRHGEPALIVLQAIEPNRLYEIEVAVEGGRVTIRVDGTPVQEVDWPAGFLADWDPGAQLTLGNEATGDRPWQGRIQRAEWTVNQTVDLLKPESLEIPATYWTGTNKLALAWAWPEWSARFWLDVSLNLFCFAMLGLVMYIGFQPGATPLGVTVVCGLLSLGVEAIQILCVDRYPSPLDWILNTGGAWLGSCLGRHWLGARGARRGNCSREEKPVATG